ncbi:hypothetical protein CQY20_08080 [Mycolicibacterium agri]|uniref:PE-PGRS family protein n=1 Tax=Mycolicibacterium agri TaxID=36811 RepID=A0A2A7N8K5_MYCAG|nr:hypothetical protein [Mycolicibacterium agri]PEG40196.1 hypothetical protein CQY20_08080 [Mycolicibacterium agri]GFG55754.1 hypothetical protein MAGR_71950 [Mycolicibacterium agri]
MTVKVKTLPPLFFAGAAATAIALAPAAAAEPAPPCVNPDGTACEVAGPGGASGEVPGGVQGGAGPGGAAGSLPGGVFGEAGPGGASGCVPGFCTTIPAP